MKILVTCAVEPEFEPWRKLRKFENVRCGDFSIQRTTFGSATVDFLVTGMGPVHSARAMEAVAGEAYSLCTASGFAGSLRAELNVGDVVIPASVRQAGGANSVQCDARLVDAGIAAGGKRIETIVSCDHVATTLSEKAQLGESAEAVDMESFTVLAAAQWQRIPAVAVRVISDRHDQALPVDLSTAVDERGQVSIGRVLKMVAGSPGQIAALMKLGRESKAAAETLARFLDGYIERVSATESQQARGLGVKG
jgi:nucleoside phosphorylase